MNTVKFLTALVEHHQVLAYGLIFLGLVFEGEIVLLSTGVLAHLGALNFNFALLFVLCGGVVKTLLGYFIGKHIHHRWHKTKFVRWLEHRVTDLIPNFSRKPFWSIFVSKFIMGANYVVIIFSGYKRIKYNTYLKAEFLSTAIWAPLMLSLGYFFSYTALGVSRNLWKFFSIVLLYIIVFIIADRLIGFIYKVFEEFYNEQK